MSLVVIVEPDASVFGKLKELLSTVEGDVKYEIVSAPDHAVELLEQGNVDVLISEMDMAVMSGQELFSLAEMISPDTVRVVMAPSNKVNEMVRFMNECKTYRIIITPVQVVGDVVDPVQSCLKYKEIRDDAKVMDELFEKEDFDTDEDYSRMESNYIENSMKYDKVVNIFGNLISHNLDLDEKSDEFKNKMKRWYRWLLDTYVNTMTLTNGNFVFCRNILMNKFHKEKRGYRFRMQKKNEFEIDNDKMNEITYMTMILANTCQTIFLRYDIRVQLEDSEKYHIIRFDCNFAGAGEDAYKEKDVEFRECLIKATEQFVNIFSYKEVMQQKGEDITINIAVPK